MGATHSLTHSRASLTCLHLLTHSLAHLLTHARTHARARARARARTHALTYLPQARSAPALPITCDWDWRTLRCPQGYKLEWGVWGEGYKLLFPGKCKLKLA